MQIAISFNAVFITAREISSPLLFHCALRHIAVTFIFYPTHKGTPVLYVIYAEDNKDSLEKRLSVRAAHLARLQILKDEDRLLTAGPMPIADSEDPGHAGFSGSVIIAEFASLDEAQTWANDDPYVAAGIYQTVTVRPFKRVF